MTFPNFIWFREFRWNQGRESFAQYCLASLLMGAAPAKWNTPYRLSTRGGELLRLLDPSFQAVPQDLEFYWEFKLGKFPEDRENGWPDLVAITDDRVLVMELKTEAGSHRDGQVDWYMRLADARYPTTRICFLYLTIDPIVAEPTDIPRQVDYRNVLWEDVANMVESVWKADDLESCNARLFAGYLKELTLATRNPLPRKRAHRPLSAPKVPTTREPDYGEDEIQEFLAMYTLTASHVVDDGKQRTLPISLASVEEAKRVQRVITTAAAREREESPVHSAILWVWTTASTGAALTDNGAEVGVELRVSKKGRPSGERDENA